MDRKRYYFSNCIEDDDLSKQAVKAKEIVQQIDHIIKIFNINNEKLYGPSPRKALSFIQRNNKSIFSPSASNESNPRNAESYEGISTSIRCNPDTSNMPRKYVPLDDAEKKEHHSATLEFSTPIGHQTPILQPTVETTLNATIDEAGTSDEPFVNQVGSKGSQEASASAEIAMKSTNLAIAEKEFGSPAKVVGSNNASSLQSPRSIQISKIKESLMKIEEELRNPAKVVGSFEARSQEFPPSSEVSIMNAGLPMVEKESRSPTKEISNIKLEKQESSRSSEIITMASSLTADDKESRNLIRNYQIAVHSAANKDFPNPGENAGKLENSDSIKKVFIAREKVINKLIPQLLNSETFDIQEFIAGNSATNKDSPIPEENASKSESFVSSNKHFISQAEGMETSEPVLTASETPSPVKRTKICSIPTFDVQECFSPSKKGRIAENSPENTQVAVNPIACAKLNISPTETINGIAREDRKRKSLSPRRRSRTLFKSIPRVQAENSPEDTKETVSRISGAQLNISPNETIKEIARDDRRRKSLSPRKRSTTFLKSMPRVIKLAEDEIDIEVVDLVYGASPTICRSKSADYRSDSTKDSVESPVDGKSKADTSPIAPGRYLRPLERMSSIGSPRNISGTYSPISDDDISAGENATGNLSIEAPVIIDLTGNIENYTADIEANPTLLKETIAKFKTILAERDKAVKNLFTSFPNFQSSINFINSYVHKVWHFILTLDVLGKCSTEEFKNIVLEANALSLKLINKLQSWEKDVDLVIFTWHKCFQQSEKLKAHYESHFTGQGETAVNFKLKVYKSAMRALWKKIYDKVMVGDTTRALFSYIAHDVERLTKMLVKCFILVGILQSR